MAAIPTVRHIEAICGKWQFLGSSNINILEAAGFHTAFSANSGNGAF
jgi:hypothetical protein